MIKTIEELDNEIMEYGHVLKLTKEEATQVECEISGMTIVQFNEKWKLIECNCDYMYCQGWIHIPRNI